MCPEDLKTEVRLGVEGRGHGEGAKGRGGCLGGEEYAQSALYTSMDQSYVAHYNKNFKDLKTKKWGTPRKKTLFI